MLKPRHQRDIRRLLALIKSFALLNLFWREREGSTVIANDQDIDEGFKLWDKIATSQELNLPPYIYNLYQEIILPAWEDKIPSKKNIAVKLESRAKKSLINTFKSTEGCWMFTNSANKSCRCLKPRALSPKSKTQMIKEKSLSSPP